jgi:hypothetical protein
VRKNDYFKFQRLNYFNDVLLINGIVNLKDGNLLGLK